MRWRTTTNMLRCPQCNVVNKLEVLKKALVEEAPMNYMVREYSTFEEYRDATYEWCGKRTTRPVDGESVDFYDPDLDLHALIEFIKTL